MAKITVTPPYWSFVVYGSSGFEVDRVDPVESYEEITPNHYKVDNGRHVYDVRIPTGGDWNLVIGVA